MDKKVRMLVEGGIMAAMAYLLDLLALYSLPQGGSITLKMVPIVFFAVRYGCGWGCAVGAIFGALNYFLGFPKAIDWTTVISDYFLAFACLGFFAGLFKGKKLAGIWGSLVGGIAMIVPSYIVGVYVWGVYMPDEFLGMHMTTPYIYSFLYNACWAFPCIILSVVIFALLYKVKPVAKLL